MLNMLLLQKLVRHLSGNLAGGRSNEGNLFLKTTLLIAGFVFSALPVAFAQVTYSVSGPIPHTTPSVFLRTSGDNVTTGATNIHAYNAGGGASTNAWSAAQTLPFPFSFFGTPVTSYVVNKNGLLSFDATLAGTTTVSSLNVNTAMPNPNLPANTVAYFWGDFDTPASGDNIWAITYGTAPNRQHWVFTYSYTMDNLGFTYNAVVFEETTNKVYVVDMYNSLGGTFTVGVQKDATTALQVSGSPNIALMNSGTANTDNDYYLFSPRPLVPADASAIGIVNPVPGVCYSATQPVEVTIQNFGTASISNVPVAARITGVGAPQVLTGTFTGTLAPNATGTVVVGNANMATAGTYNIKAYTALATDGFINNDTLLPAAAFTVDPIVALPLNMDFTGFTGSNLSTVFPDWTEMSDAAPSPTGTTSNWTSDDYINTTTHANGTAAKINLDAASDNVWIVSPKITATATTALRFDLALTDWNGTGPVTMGSDDELRIMVSTDCGNTFTAIRTYSATTPISNLGQKETVSLAAYAGQNIHVAIYATEGTVNDPEDNDLFIDNVFVGTPPAIDLAATVLVSPTNNSCFTAPEPVIVTIYNFGTNTLNFATTPATVTVNVTGAATQTIPFTVNTGTLAPNASTNVTVGNFNMSANGTYTFNGSVAITGDGDASNNSFPAVSILNGTISTFPALQDFENFTPVGDAAAGNAGWTGTTSGLIWEIEEGTSGSTGTGPSVDHTTGTTTGNYVFLETSSGSTGDEAELVTPCINLTGHNNMALEFWYHMFGATIDTLMVDIFNGTTYVNNVFVIGGQQQTATTDPWLKATVNLAPFGGNAIKVRFRGKRGSSFTGDIAIDDVSIVAIPAPTVTAGGPTTFCQGDSVILTATSTTPGVTFAWELNGTPIAGATGSTFTANASGSYTAVASLGGASAPTVITVNPAPATPVITQNGGTLTSSTASGNQWYLNGTAIAGATGQTHVTTTNGAYTVIVTGANSCESEESAVVNVTNTGIKDALAGMSVEVYPNPASGSFNVKLNGYQKNATVVLYNLAGQQITAKKATADGKVQNISLKGLAAGTYLLKVTSEKGVQVSRLIVQ